MTCPDCGGDVYTSGMHASYGAPATHAVLLSGMFGTRIFARGTRSGVACAATRARAIGHRGVRTVPMSQVYGLTGIPEGDLWTTG